MTKKITILGAGPGGYVAAIRAAQLGAEVTLIERDNVGGTCLNWGCIPSKVMKTTADLYCNFQRASEFGILINGTIDFNIKKLMARKEKIVQSQIKGVEKLLNQYKIRYLKGHGILRDIHCVDLVSHNAASIRISGDQVILALGSKPKEDRSIPFDGNYVLSSNDVFALNEVPESLVIVGGGVVGCEFASIFATFGTKVVLLEAFDRLLPLPSVDESCSSVLEREMKKRNIRIMVRSAITEARQQGLKIQVTVKTSGKTIDNDKVHEKIEIITADKLLVCIGRSPVSEESGLNVAGIVRDAGGWVDVNNRLETNIKGLYAIGDMLGPSKAMLAHVASQEGIVAAENAMGASKTIDYTAVPGAIFTTPEVASVGITEKVAREQGTAFHAETLLFRTLGMAHVVGNIAGQIKIIADLSTRKIIGVHIIGTHATELIAEATLAVKNGLTIKELAETVHAHPTLSEIVGEASRNALYGGLY